MIPKGTFVYNRLANKWYTTDEPTDDEVIGRGRIPKPADSHCSKPDTSQTVEMGDEAKCSCGYRGVVQYVNDDGFYKLDDGLHPTEGTVILRKGAEIAAEKQPDTILLKKED